MKRGMILLALAAACGPTPKKVTPTATVTVELKAAPALGHNGSPPTLSGSKISTPGLVIAINNDSDGSGVDSTDNLVNGAHDTTQMTSFIITHRTATAVTGDKMHVIKKSGSGSVRVF